MMNPAPTDFSALIAQGEGETLEFKRSVAELDQVVETTAALANTRGGLVLIGIGLEGQSLDLHHRLSRPYCTGQSGSSNDDRLRQI